MKKNLLIILAIILIFTMSACGIQPEPLTNPGTQSPASQNSAPQSPANGDKNSNNSPAITSAAESQNYFTVIDARGVEVFFEKTPEKIVSLMPSNTEIIYALDSGKNIVAVSDYCNYPEDTANKEKFPTGEMLSIEAIIALEADVLFLGNMSSMEDQINQLELAGIKVVVTEANNLLQTYDVIEMIGNTLGKKAEAQAIIKEMKDGFIKIKSEVEANDSAKIYIEVSPLEYGLWSCGTNTFIHELIEIVGAKNIFEDVEGWVAVSEEQVLTRNPDVIITTASPLTGIEDPVKDILSRNNWNGLEAVKNKKVVMINGDLITLPSPRLLDGAKELLRIMSKVF